MSVLASLYSAVFERMPFPVRLVMNLAVLPFVVCRLLWMMVSRHVHASPIDKMSEADLAALIHATHVAEDPLVKEIDTLRDQAKSFMDAGDWDGLNTALETADAEGASLLSGRRHTTQVFEIHWDLVMGDLSRRNCDPMGQDVLDAGLLAGYVGACATYPEAVGLRALAAYLLVQLSWARRGAHTADRTPEEAFEAMVRCRDLAWDLLDEVPEAERNRPMFCEVAFEATAGMGAEAPDVIAAYEAWRRADPTSIRPFVRAGRFLLSRWYGTPETFDNLAREAYAATHQTSGAAAYSAFFDDVLADDWEVWSILDTDLYLQGLEDRIVASADPAGMANSLLALLNDACCAPYGSVPDWYRVRQDALRTGLHRLIRSHLDVLYPERWGEEYETILYILGHAYSTEILAGETVCLDSKVASC